MRVLSRRRLLLVISALGVAAVSAGAPTGAPAWAAADSTVVAPVRALIDALLTVMKQGHAVPFKTRADALAPVIDQSFDLGAILRQSVGPPWSAIPPADQDALRMAFRDYTIASYTNSFDTFSGQRFVVEPDVRTVGNGDQVVQTRIVSASGDGHELAYVMRSIGGTWRIVDVLADGSVSRVAVQRSDFRHLLANGGVAALIASLRTKVRDLSS